MFPDNGKGGEEEWNPWEEDERAHSLVLQKRRDAFRSYQDHVAKNRPKTYKVQIWGKAAIGKWNMFVVSRDHCIYCCVLIGFFFSFFISREHN